MNAVNLETSPPGATVVDLPALHRTVGIPIDGVELPGELVLPAGAKGLALFMMGTGCVRETPRATRLAQILEEHGVATLTFSLLTGREAERDRHFGALSFDLELLTHRLLQATNWAMQAPETRDLGIGYMGTSTFAAAALVAAGQLGYAVEAVVSRSGRPDFAAEFLPRVMAPTLLIVGERDEVLLEMNRSAMKRLGDQSRIEIIPGAGHLFEEDGALEHVGALAADWFNRHLKPVKRI
jgi:putative phosphoribosyl transferase